MNIVWVTSEAAPYAKTGGLADVSSALPKALAEKGHKVSVIMPYYPQVMKELTLKTEVVYPELGVPLGWATEWAQIREHKISENLSFYFVEYDLYFDRPTLYDYNGVEFGDNASRFIFFARAAMQTVMALNLNPDILHTNDWTAALCCVYLKTPLYWDNENFKDCKSVVTIHNIGYQGTFDKANLFMTGLGWEYFNESCLEFNDRLNFLKAGIMTADMVNAVSPTYAKEILTTEYGFSLDQALGHVAHRNKLRGILNGIDADEWNPATDKLLPAQFSDDDMSGKAVCKEELQRKFSLPLDPDIPVFGIVSRLATQKGIDLFAGAVEAMLVEAKEKFQVVILGTGDKAVESHLAGLNARFPEQFSVYIGYDNKIAHLIEGGADFFVMPSRYEPCGLNQMYSMRYGTLPVVRGTGGLEDTVINYDTDDLENCNGFKFYILSEDSIKNTLIWSIGTYEDKKVHFAKMISNGMLTDFSWDRTASEYEEMYIDA